MSAPRITVLMAVHNGARYLDAAVQSILCQTWSDFEFLIVDDGSTDDTSLRLAGYHDERMRVVRTENRGVGAALSLGVREARGEFIARMDADDIAAPNRLERQLAAMESMPEVGVVDSGVHLMDRQGRPLPDDVTDAFFSRAERRWRLMWRNAVVHPTVMLRKSVLDRTGENYRPRVIAEDYDLWLRLVPHTEFYRLPEQLLWYRRHAESVTAKWGRQHFDCLAGIIQDGLERMIHVRISNALAEDLAFLTRQTFQRPEEYVPQSSTGELIEIMHRVFDAVTAKYEHSAAEAAQVRAEAAEQLLDWAWLLERCRRPINGGTRHLALAALSYRPGALFSGRFARHLVASLLGSRNLGHLRRALRS